MILNISYLQTTFNLICFDCKLAAKSIVIDNKLLEQNHLPYLISATLNGRLEKPLCGLYRYFEKSANEHLKSTMFYYAHSIFSLSSSESAFALFFTLKRCIFSFVLVNRPFRNAGCRQWFDLLYRHFVLMGGRASRKNIFWETYIPPTDN